MWSASEIFGDSIVENIIQGLELWPTFKTILLYGGQQHDEHLQCVLENAERPLGNLKLNQEKCEFRLNELKVVGHIFSADGVRVDSEKVETISDMPSPHDKSVLGQLPPGQLPPRQLPPDNYPPDNYPPRTNTPWTITPPR